MTSVTYRHQGAVHKVGGSVPLAGTKIPYTVDRLLWPSDVEEYLRSRFIGRVLHLCCGKSQLGDVRADLYEHNVDLCLDATRVPFPDRSFDTVLIDPPYTGRFQESHDMLSEVARVAARRFIFQHWFCPVNRKGQFKKAHVYKLTEAVVVPDLGAHVGELIACLYDAEAGVYYVAEHPSEDWVFQLQELRFWQPSTYFGRVQLISIFDR